jgi:ABC-type transport system involved in cytochrome bd biosynthesis fused ATPase/permease subunit
MIDNAIFLIVMIFVPYFCYLGFKRDQEESSKQMSKETRLSQSPFQRNKSEGQ